jgi:hypothetical protein
MVYVTARRECFAHHPRRDSWLLARTPFLYNKLPTREALGMIVLMIISALFLVKTAPQGLAVMVKLERED